MGIADSEQIKWLELVATGIASEQHKNTVSNKDTRELLNWTLEKLSIEDRTLIEMIYFEGQSMKEAAEVLSWGSSASCRISMAKWAKGQRYRSILSR